MIQAIKLADNNTTIELDTDTGELTERGKSFPVLHRPVEDSVALFRLLYDNRQVIAHAYLKLHPKNASEAVSVDARDDFMLGESGPKTGVQSSITLDDGLKHDTGFIHKTRGA